MKLYEQWKNFDERKEMATILSKMPKPKPPPNRSVSSNWIFFLPVAVFKICNCTECVSNVNVASEQYSICRKLASCCQSRFLVVKMACLHVALGVGGSGLYRVGISIFWYHRVAQQDGDVVSSSYLTLH